MATANTAVAGNGMYPPIGTFSEQTLPVSPLHSVYLEQSGKSAGFPALFLHGGPGSQTNPEHRRFFDPDFYRIILFDQRGCGRSSPAGCTEQNTIWDLVEDMETIRRELGVTRWLLFGGSWGSTLGLAYAASYPQRVAGLILRGVFLASRGEIDWYVHGLRGFVPEAWARLVDGYGSDVVAGYQRDVNHPDPVFAAAAARRWLEYEQSVMAIGGPLPTTSGVAPDSALLARARVQLHYLAAGCFLREGQLLASAGSVAMPVIIVHGRTDMVCRPLIAYELSQRLPAAQLRIIEQAGHAASGPRLAAALRIAADDMRELLARAE